jgi:hypothetical protein
MMDEEREKDNERDPDEDEGDPPYQTQQVAQNHMHIPNPCIEQNLRHDNPCKLNLLL